MSLPTIAPTTMLVRSKRERSLFSSKSQTPELEGLRLPKGCYRKMIQRPVESATMHTADQRTRRRLGHEWRTGRQGPPSVASQRFHEGRGARKKTTQGGHVLVSRKKIVNKKRKATREKQGYGKG